LHTANEQKSTEKSEWFFDRLKPLIIQNLLKAEKGVTNSHPHQTIKFFPPGTDSPNGPTANDERETLKALS